MGAIHTGVSDPVAAIEGSDVVVLATPVGKIIEMIARLGPRLSPRTLLTDVGSTKAAIVSHAKSILGENSGARFLPGHPMAGKENSGIDHAHAELFRGAVWFITPQPGEDVERGRLGEYLRWLKKIGVKVAVMTADEHDELCAWISHVPQMVSTALASTLIEEYGNQSSLLDAGGRALREMTRIASSPYSMWRDIAITNKNEIANALLKLERKLAHIRENLDTRELEAEFNRAHKLKNPSPQGRRDTGKRKR